MTGDTRYNRVTHGVWLSQDCTTVSSRRYMAHRRFFYMVEKRIFLKRFSRTRPLRALWCILARSVAVGPLLAFLPGSLAKGARAESARRARPRARSARKEHRACESREACVPHGGAPIALDLAGMGPWGQGPRFRGGWAHGPMGLKVKKKSKKSMSRLHGAPRSISVFRSF